MHCFSILTVYFVYLYAKYIVCNLHILSMSAALVEDQVQLDRSAATTLKALLLAHQEGVVSTGRHQ